MIDAASQGRALAAVVSGCLRKPVAAAVDAGFCGAAEIELANRGFAKSPFAYDQGNRHSANEIIMCAGFRIIAISPARGLVSLNRAILLQKSWKGFVVWRIVESVICINALKFPMMRDLDML